MRPTTISRFRFDRRWHLFAIPLTLGFLVLLVFRLQNAMIFEIRGLLDVKREFAVEEASKNRNVSPAVQPFTKTWQHPLHHQDGDWFRKEDWHNNEFTKDCWNVENICHSSHRWFYDPRSRNTENQPSFSFEVYEPMNRATTLGGRFAVSESSSTFLGRPRRLVVRTPRSENPLNSSTRDEDLGFISFLQTSCTYSLIPNHVVLQSFYNDMLGEFYTRSLIYLHKIYASITRPNKNGTFSEEAREPSRENFETSSFLQQSQLYLHVENFPEFSKLLDSHHVFTDAFRSNPLLSFNTLLDYTGCRCLRRLFFCGYDEYKDDENGKQRQMLAGVFPHNASQITELQPAGTTGPYEMEKRHPEVFPELRQQLRHRIIERNHFLLNDVINFRTSAIALQRPGLSNLTEVEVGEFRIIGLTQRKGRRKWLNLDEIVQTCNNEWFNDSAKAVCVEINLENEDVNPVRQVVMHAACNMLIGIHGAQLTEAVWMKDGSTVLELLPWLADENGYGSWSRSVVTPTPLGELFSGCPLNHIGYRLPRESAPYCQDINDPDNLTACFDGYLWDDRDFQVEAETVRDMIKKFAPKSGVTAITDPASCEELIKKSGDRVYVLYNVICSNSSLDKITSPSVHHYYWPPT